MTYAHDVLPPEVRQRLGLSTPPPATPDDEAIAKAMGMPVDEAMELRGVMNADDYAEAERRIVAIRKAKAEIAEAEAMARARKRIAGD